MSDIWTFDSGEPPFGALGRKFYGGYDGSDERYPLWLFRVMRDHGEGNYGSIYTGGDYQLRGEGEWTRAPKESDLPREKPGSRMVDSVDFDDDDLAGHHIFDTFGLTPSEEVDAMESMDKKLIFDMETSTEQDTAKPLSEKIRGVFERLPPRIKDRLYRGNLSDGERWTLLHILDNAVYDDTRYRKAGGGVILYPFAHDPNNIVLWNGGPHTDFSGIGVPSGVASILMRNDMKGHLFHEALLRDLEKSKWYNERRGKYNDSIIDNPVERFSAIMHGAARDELDKVGDILGDSKLRDMLEKVIADKYMRSYVPSAGFFNGLVENGDSEMKDYWTDFMYLNLMRFIQNVLRDSSGWTGDGGTLTQVAVPLDALRTNDDVLAGGHSGQRDNMFEAVFNRYKLIKDLGTAAELLERNGKIDNFFRLVRKEKMRPEHAYGEAIGDSFGNVEYLISDEDKKKVYKMCMDDIDNYCSRQNICAGLQRGPGND